MRVQENAMTQNGYEDKNMFKKIVKAIAAIKTENDRDECYWQIDRAFEEEHISFEDHELLYGLVGMVEVA